MHLLITDQKPQHGDVREPDEVPFNDTVPDLGDEISNLRGIDTQEGCFRHAAFIDTRLLGLYLTRDNIKTVLDSVDDRTGFIESVIACFPMPQALGLTAESLAKIEKIWTGVSHHVTPSEQDENFSTKIIYRTWLDDQWEQVRELNYLAVSTSALETLLKIVNKSTIEDSEALSVPEDRLGQQIEHLHASSIRFNPRAAISRVWVSINARTVSDENSTTIKMCLSRQGIMSPESANINRAYSLVHGVAKAHTSGRFQWTVPYIRRSARHDKQTKERTIGGHPFKPPGSLKISGADAGYNMADWSVVVGDCQDSPSVCIYKTSPPIELPNAKALQLDSRKMLDIDRLMHWTCRYPPKMVPTAMQWKVAYANKSRDEEDVYTNPERHYGRVFRAWEKSLAAFVSDENVEQEGG